MVVRGRQVHKVKWFGVLWIVPVGLLAGWLASSSLLASILLILGSLLAMSAVVWGSTLTQRRLIITLLVCSILLPGIPVPGLLQIRPEELLVLALLPAVVVSLNTRLNRFDLVFGLIGVSTMLSMAWGTLGQGAPLSPRDLMELVKLARFWLFFRVALYPWTEQDIRTIVVALLISMAIAVLIGILQFTNWMGIGGMLESVYTQGAAHTGKGRVVGTLPSPNYFALLMASGLAFVVGAIEWVRHRWMLVVLGIAMIGAIGVTLSRAGILAAGVVLLVTIALRIMWLRRISFRRWIGWLILAILILLVVGGAATAWLRGEFQSLEDMSDSEKLEYSWQGPVQRLIFRFSFLQEGQETRIRIWQSHLADFSQSPWLGWGPGKALQGTVTDNGYVLYLRRYGIVGMALYSLLYWQILRIGWKILHIHSYRSAMWATALSVIAITLAYLVSNVSVEVFYQLQLMSFFWLVVGVGYSTLYFQGRLPAENSGGATTGGSPFTS